MDRFVAFMIGPHEPVYIILGGGTEIKIAFCDKLKDKKEKKEHPPIRKVAGATKQKVFIKSPKVKSSVSHWGWGWHPGNW